MLRQSPLLRRGAKLILWAGFGLLFLVTGAAIADAIDAVVSATVLGS